MKYYNSISKIMCVIIVMFNKSDMKLTIFIYKAVRRKALFCWLLALENVRIIRAENYI